MRTAGHERPEPRAHGVLAVVAVVTALATTGCSSAISPELHDARLTVARAQAGAAARHEAERLAAARSTLERAEAERDGSAREAQLAYLAEREALRAAADARATELAEQVERDRRTYAEELAEIARRTGEPLETTRERLARSELSLQQQQALLAEREQELALEQATRAEESAVAREALESLRTVALVETGPEQSVITLRVEDLFVGGRGELIPEARAQLAAIAAALAQADGHDIVVGVHTDGQGDETRNIRLSQRRAEAIRSVLREEGVPIEHMTAVGHGETEPVASNDTREGRASNRRVEIVVRPAADLLEHLPTDPGPTLPAPTTPEDGETPSGAIPQDGDRP